MKQRLQRHLRLIAVWAMLLPFFGASLIANGIMPTMAPNGVIMLVICTGDGMVEMAFDPVTMEPIAEAGDSPASGAGTCDWSASHPVFNLPPITTLQANNWQSNITAPPLGATVLRIAAATGLPPSTGPPVLF